MSGHLARRLVTAGVAALALAGPTASPAAASYDVCSSYHTEYGFTYRACMTVSQGTNAWQYVGIARYNGGGTWSSCSLQLRLFHGASANVQVRYHSAPCNQAMATPGSFYELWGTPAFCPQPGNSYKASMSIVGVLNGQSVAHGIVTPVVPYSTGDGTCGNAGVNPALPELPGVLVPAV